MEGKVPLLSQVSTKYFLSSFCTADGECMNCTGLQLPGVLDDLFSYSGPLGALFSEEAVSLYLWAPTAQVYFLLLKKILISMCSSTSNTYYLHNIILVKTGSACLHL